LQVLPANCLLPNPHFAADIKSDGRNQYLEQTSTINMGAAMPMLA